MAIASVSLTTIKNRHNVAAPEQHLCLRVGEDRARSSASSYNFLYETPEGTVYKLAAHSSKSWLKYGLVNYFDFLLL